MAKIGSYGSIVFEVSDKKTQTFRDFQRSGPAKWNEHEIIGQKSKYEFSGPGLEEINFSMLLKAELGVNPEKQLVLLRNMRDQGKAASFIIGGKPVSQNYWVIQQLTEAHKTIDSNGNLLAAEVEVTLKEYVLSKTARR